MRSTRLPSSIERFLGFGPRPLPPHVFFLSGRQLAYASFTGPGGDRRGLAAFRRVALPPDLFTPGPLAGPARDPAVLADALRELTQAFPEPVEEASLVVPDAWMRVTFTEGGDLPDNPRVRDEAVRFKLKRLVPFRVEELRVHALEVGNRLVIGFALDNLLSQVEEIFEEQGVRLGQIVNASLNQTLARTLMTGITTLLVLVGLATLGGQTLFGFSVALIFGILIGTYSSIYIASASLLELNISTADLVPAKREEVDELP